MKKSEIMGVHWITDHRTWIARDVKKNVLYRGQSMEKAEAARIAYDKARGRDSRKSLSRGVYGYSKREKYDKVFQPVWPISTV